MVYGVIFCVFLCVFVRMFARFWGRWAGSGGFDVLCHGILLCLVPATIVGFWGVISCRARAGFLGGDLVCFVGVGGGGGVLGS